MARKLFLFRRAQFVFRKYRGPIFIPAPRILTYIILSNTASPRLTISFLHCGTALISPPFANHN
jgi:hypothetical protein